MKERCKNKCNYLYCEFHHFKIKPKFIYSFFILLAGAIIGIDELSSALGFEKKPIEYLYSKKNVCNRNDNIGCTIKFNTTKNSTMNFIEGTEIIQKVHSTNLDVVVGSKRHSRTFIMHEEIFDGFKVTRKNYDIPGFPYSISVSKNNIGFSGVIKNYKTGFVVCEFGEEEFELRQKDGTSWNLDSKGIEIIDRHGNVCFGIEYFDKQKIISYRGYFFKDSIYHIINDKYIKTKNLDDAEKEIEKIKRHFAHVGENSTGIRIYNPHTFDKKWTSDGKFMNIIDAEIRDSMLVDYKNKKRHFNSSIKDSTPRFVINTKLNSWVNDTVIEIGVHNLGHRYGELESFDAECIEFNTNLKVNLRMNLNSGIKDILPKLINTGSKYFDLNLSNFDKKRYTPYGITFFIQFDINYRDTITNKVFSNREHFHYIGEGNTLKKGLPPILINSLGSKKYLVPFDFRIGERNQGQFVKE